MARIIAAHVDNDTRAESDDLPPDPPRLVRERREDFGPRASTAGAHR
jgi:hypothetical protein